MKASIDDATQMHDVHGAHHHRIDSEEHDLLTCGSITWLAGSW